MVVDYSRWDRLELGSSGDEGEGAAAGGGRPRVTRLAPGEAVSVGGVTARADAAPPPPRARVTDDDADADADGGGGGGGAAEAGAEGAYYEDEAHAAREEDLRAQAAAAEASGEAAAARRRRAAEDAERAGARGARRRAALCANGADLADGAGAGYLWAQSADEVSVHAVAPPGTRARQVRVALRGEGLVAGESVASALRVTLDGEVLLDGALGGKVALADGDDEGEEIDWTLADLPGDAKGRRVVSVTMRKVSPGAGVRQWWNRALEGGPEIDTSAIAGRSTYGVGASPGDSKPSAGALSDAGGSGSGKSFAEVFAEAEKAFREKVKHQKPIELHLTPGDGAAEP